jgi:predicted DNA-binding transcriptional regulator AlpA
MVTTTTELLTRNAVAAMLHVSPQTLMIWVTEGKFPSPIRIGRRALWPQTTVDRVLQRHAEQSVETSVT